MNMRLSVGAALCVLTLAGCDMPPQQPLTPQLQTQMMQNMQSGSVNLDCTLGCMLSWNTSLNHIHGLDIAENWQDLGVTVMRIGYRSDLAYYYLGQAAQGLGYHDAAIKYYRTSAAISAGDMQGQFAFRCEMPDGSIDLCKGIDLPSVLPTLIEASQSALKQQQEASDAAARASDPPPKRKSVKKAAPKPTDPGWVLPSSTDSTP